MILGVKKEYQKLASLCYKKLSMSKKSLNVILKNGFSNYKELSKIYISFRKKIKSLKKNNYLIAVSGGPDSLALTALSKAYSYENKCKFHYLLIDHNLRKNSSSEAKSVKKLLKKHWFILKIVKNKKLIDKNIQSNARDIRYNLIKNYCKNKNIKIILTAHNLEDQVETFFIRLSRGSGLQGLSSMKQVNQLIKIFAWWDLVRFQEKQLIKISKLAFGKYFKDPTNFNIKYQRTQIISLKKHLEDSCINYDQVFKSIKNLASSRDTLDAYFSFIYKKIINKKRNKIYINVKNFFNYNDEIKMRVLMNSITNLTNSYYAPRSKKVLNLIKNIKDTSGLRKLTLGGCHILKDKNYLILSKEKKN